MNYYTESFPESTRPPELNRHLYGDRQRAGIKRYAAERVAEMVALPRTLSARVEDGGLACGYAAGGVRRPM